jgi:hypothetical protein
MKHQYDENTEFLLDLLIAIYERLSTKHSEDWRRLNLELCITLDDCFESLLDAYSVVKSEL